MKYYRVEQSEQNHDRQPLTGATFFDAAQCRMMSIVENMRANGWWRTDDSMYKKLANAVVLANGQRVVALSVVECGANEVTGTRLELRELPWLTRAFELVEPRPLELVNVNTDDLNTPSDIDVTDQYGDGYDVNEEEARNG